MAQIGQEPGIAPLGEEEAETDNGTTSHQDYFSTLGRALQDYKRRDFQSCIPLFAELLENPAVKAGRAKALNILTHLGHAHYGLGEKEKAQEYFEKAVELDPGNEIAHYGLYCLHEEGWDFEKALEHITATVEANPTEHYLLELMDFYAKHKSQEENVVFLKGLHQWFTTKGTEKHAMLIRIIEERSATSPKEEERETAEPGAEEEEREIAEPAAEEEEREIAEPAAEEEERETAEPVPEEEERETAEPVPEEEERETAEPGAEEEEREIAEPVAEEEERETAEPAAKEEEREIAEPVAEEEEREIAEPVAEEEERETSEPERIEDTAALEERLRDLEQREASLQIRTDIQEEMGQQMEEKTADLRKVKDELQSEHQRIREKELALDQERRALKREREVQGQAQQQHQHRREMTHLERDVIKERIQELEVERKRLRHREEQFQDEVRKNELRASSLDELRVQLDLRKKDILEFEKAIMERVKLARDSVRREQAALEEAKERVCEEEKRFRETKKGYFKEKLAPLTKEGNFPESEGPPPTPEEEEAAASLQEEAAGEEEPEEGGRLSPEAKQHFLLGNHHLKRHHFEQAAKCYSKVLQMEPDLGEVWNNLGVAFDEMGLATKALHCYDTAIDIDENYIEALLNKGYNLMDRQLYESAVGVFLQVLELDPGNSGAQEYHEYCQHRMKRF